jgi:hypothetical protein
MTPEERLAYLLEVVAIPSNRGRLTHSWVAENVSLAAADAVYAAINSVSQPTALRYNVGNGIDTSAALWKAQAEAVAESDESLAPYLESLRDFELIRMPRWQSEGYDSEPRLEQITREVGHERILSLVAEVRSASAAALDAGTDPIAAARAVWEAAEL